MATTKKRIYPNCRFFRIFNLKMFVLDFVKITGWLPFLLVYRPKYIFQNKKLQNRIIKGRAIVIANHNSLMDPICLCYAFAFRRIRYLAAEVLFEKSRLFAWMIRSVGCLRINRNIVDLKSMRRSLDELNEDGVISLFPEGKLSSDNSTIQSFKSGVILLALKSNAPVIPVYIAYTNKSFHRKHIVIGEPIDITKYCANKIPTIAEIEKLSNVLREAEEKLLNLYEQTVKKD